MPRLSIIAEGVLYRNPRPGYRAECAYVPNCVPLSEDELLCAYRLGSAFYSADGRVALVRSLDRGRTWTAEGLAWDGSGDSRPYSYTAPHLSRLRDGTLLLLTSRKDASDPDLPDFDPETGELWNRETVLFRSSDEGRTWSPPAALDLPGGARTDTPSQIIELDDGSWFLACEEWGKDAAGVLHITGFALFSTDRGATWGRRVDFPSAGDPSRMFSHSRYTRLLDGRIAALQWAQERGSNANLELHLVTAEPDGRRWGLPQPTGIMGQTSWLADLGHGILVANCSLREGMSPGMYVILSTDSGRTWDAEGKVQVWDAVGQEYLGVTHKPTYPASHDNIAFGKPHAVRLPAGELLVSWWCTQACVTHARYALLELER